MRLKQYRAAGGILLDETGRVLVIEREVVRNGECHHEIRLPKGHVEANETDVEAAVREVCEETGYCGLAVVADLGEALTEFDWDGVHVRRDEHYYLMRLTDPTQGTPHFDSPTAEEARFVPRWVPSLAEAESELTFESERDFVRRARSATSGQ